jgi:Uma2 family endonuclease
MVMIQAPLKDELIVYRESDGRPMSDNTKQYRWIVRLTENLKRLFHGQRVFVTADLFWYPIEGNPKIVIAPDVMVVLDRPAGDRRSYQQWQEDNSPPQVVFEIISLSNSASEISSKQEFYLTSSRR